MAHLVTNPYFVYNPLPENSIRLLKTHHEGSWEEPSDMDEDLEVSLITVALDSHPPYLTLSYTWGDASPLDSTENLIFTKAQRCYPINCHGKLLLATRNLRDALRRLKFIQRLRHPPHDLRPAYRAHLELLTGDYGDADLFWIDSLCINQDDTSERSSQVSLMGTIYRQAHCTIAWLGEADKYTKPAVQALARISEQPGSGGGLQVIPNTLLPLENEMRHRDTLRGTDLAALSIFFSRNWFRRLWVLQEIILSPQVSLLQGSIVMSIEIVLFAGFFLLGREALFGASKRLVGISENAPAVRRMISQNALPDIPSSYLKLLLNARRQMSQGHFLDFFATMLMSQHCEVTDPRDRIYAILALVDALQVGGTPRLIPDYNLSPRKVYVDATCKIIESQKDLRFLLLSADESLKHIEGLPSWCPDYSIIDTRPRITEGIRHAFWQSEPVFDISRTEILEVSGFCYDVIDRVVDPMSKDAADHGKSRSPAPDGRGVAALFELAVRPEAACLQTNQSRTTGESPCLYPSSSLHRSSGISKLEELWRFLIRDTFAGQTPGPRVAVVFLPLLVALGLCLQYESEPCDDEESIAQEIHALCAIFQELTKQDPYHVLFLPSSDLLWALPALPSRGVDRTEEYMNWVCENDPIQDRAVALGLGDSLQQVIQESPDVDVPDSIEPLKSKLTGTKLVGLREAYLYPVFAATLIHRSVFTTRKRHHFGLGNMSILPGDEVWFLSGLVHTPTPGDRRHVPGIMRPLGAGTYRFMGECYIYGIEIDEIPPEEERIARGMEVKIRIV